MALWNGSNINSNDVALAFNRMWWPNTIYFGRRLYGFWYAITGMNEPGNYQDGRFGVETMSEMTGNKLELSLVADVPTWDKIGFGQPELETLTHTYNDAEFGGIEFDATHYNRTRAIPWSDMQRLKGDNLKTESYLENVINVEAEGYVKTVAADIHGNTNQTDTSLLGLQYLVSTTTTYGLNRSDAAHADWRSYVTNGGALSNLDPIQLAQANIRNRMGSGAMILTGVTLYQKIQSLLENELHGYSDPEWSAFSGQYVRFGNSVMVMDGNTPSGYVYILSPEHFKLAKSGEPVDPSQLMWDPSRKSAYVIPMNALLAFGCKNPAAQGLLTSTS